MNNIPELPPGAIIGAPKPKNVQQEVAGPEIVLPANAIIGDPIPARSFDPIKNQEEEIDGWEKAWTNFNLAKDEIELGMWQGMKLQAESDPYSFGAKFKRLAENMGDPDFIINRIEANEIDIQKEAAKLKNSSQPDFELTFTDIFKENFWEEDLPKIMGGMAGLMFEPLIVGGTAGAIAGSVFSLPGTIAGAIGGTAALLTSRPFEGLAEANESYSQAKETLKNLHPDWSEDQLNKSAIKAFEYTYNKNIELGIKDAGEIAISFIPFGRMFAPFARPGAGIIQKVATRASMFAYKHKSLDALFRLGLVSSTEAAEELVQHKIKLNALEVAQGNETDSYTSLDTWSELMDDAEAMYSTKAGFIGGLAMGGPGALVSRFSEAFKKTQKDISAGDYEAVMKDQELARAKLLTRAALGDTVKDKNGKTIREYDQRIPLLVSLEKLARAGMFGTATTNDKDQLKKSSMQHLNDVLLPEIETELRTIRSLYKSNPKIKDQNNLALMRFNARQIKKNETLLEKLDEKLPESQQSILDINKEIAMLMMQNAEIIKGVDVYGQEKAERAAKPKKEKEVQKEEEQPVDESVDDMFPDFTVTADAAKKPAEAKAETSELAVDENGDIIDNGEPDKVESEPEEVAPKPKKDNKKAAYDMAKVDVKYKLEKDSKELEKTSKQITDLKSVNELVEAYPDDIYEDEGAFHKKALKEDAVYAELNKVNDSIQNSEFDGPETPAQARALENLVEANILSSDEIKDREKSRKATSAIINEATRRIKYLQQQIQDDKSLSKEEKAQKKDVLVNSMKAISKVMTLSKNIDRSNKINALIDFKEVSDDATFKKKKKELTDEIDSIKKEISKTESLYERTKKPGLKYKIQDLISELKSIEIALDYLNGEFETEPPATTSIKPGVEELFDENPELANAVYEALGFKTKTSENEITRGIKEILPFKVIGDYSNIEEGLTGRSQYSTTINGNNYVFDISTYSYENEDGTFESYFDIDFTVNGSEDIVGTGFFDKSEKAKQIIQALISQNYGNNTIRFNVEESKKGKQRLLLYKRLMNQLGYNPSGEMEYALFYDIKRDKVNLTPQQKQQAQQLYSQYLDTIFPDSKVIEIDNSLYISVLNQLEQENKIEKDCSGKLKAEKGLQTNFTKNGEWKIIKDLKGYPTHKEGGVDLTISKNGVSIKNGDTEFTAKHGLVIPKN